MRRSDVKLMGRCLHCSGTLVYWLRGMALLLGGIGDGSCAWVELACPSCLIPVRMEKRAVLPSRKKQP